MASKILKVLAREGLLTSQRGTKGGYTLARSPECISVAEIIRALEGPIALTECTDRVYGDCGLERLCPTRGNWHKINQAIRDALEKVTLAEMVQPIPPCPVDADKPVTIRDLRDSSRSLLP